ncbi:MAG: DsrE/DsrF/DrsH-like family protein, partial [Victivallaceae bacterium]|nr:DsrE/DsrF/DrsH-like family protein [Victivallaceae bacterium]
AGIACGLRGHIIVDEHMRTSDLCIYAAGDVVECVDPLLGGRAAVPLAGPANKQGRIVADNIAGGSCVYRGSFGTSVVKVGALTAATVGLTEARLRAANRKYRKIYLHPSSSAGYYPGAARLDMKLCFDDAGTILGAQIVGRKGVDKRIDDIAGAMRSGLTAPELGELELAYAPPYSSAKDPVNFAGFIAGNVLSGRSNIVTPDSLPEDAQIVDVREKAEFELGALPGAVNVPLGELRDRLSELDNDRPIVVYCQVGLRGYLAERILKQHGRTVFNLSGGYLTWRMFHPAAELDGKCSTQSVVSSQPAAPAAPAAETLDLRALACPGPVMRLKTAMDKSAGGARLHLLAATTFEGDLRRWASSSGNTLENLVRKEDWIEADVVRGTGNAVSAAGVCVSEGKTASIVLFSNDFDKAMAALILANGFAAAGMKVGIFFTFWGVSVLRKKPEVCRRKDLLSRMFGWMLPRGPEKLALSKMNFAGMGAAMMKQVMASKHVATLPELIRSAKASGVKFIACEMAMEVMGLAPEELDNVDEIAGVASFVELAQKQGPTIFV